MAGRTRLWYAAASILLSGTVPAAAQNADLSTLARSVIESNPRIQAQRAAVEALRARLRSARAGANPSLQANGIAERRRLNVIGGPGDQTFNIGQGEVEARLPLFDGFRTANGARVARAELEAGQAVLDATIQEVMLQLVTALADLQRDRLVRDYAQQQFGAIESQLRATGRLVQFGEATKTDQNQAQARLAAAQATLIAAEEEAGSSAAAYEAVTGQSAATAPPPPELPPLPGTLETARAQADDSPAVRAAKGNAEAAGRAVDVARGALLPQVDLVGGFQYLTGGVANLFIGRLPDDRSALFGGVSARVPIFQQGREYAEIDRTKAVRSQRLQQVAATLRDVVQDVDTAWTRWRSANATIEVARRAVTANEQAAEGVRKEALGGGSRTLLDVLNAQNELLQARATLERGVRNQYVARAAVLATLGQLSPERPATD